MGIHERWLDERRHEHYYKLAKKTGYRSRASFKIMQIDDRFNIFKKGNLVVDLGAFPGGWLQVVKNRIGDDGKVIGVDLKSIKPISGVETIRGDITDSSVIFELSKRLGKKVDVVLSDMAPNITGNYTVDHARSINLCTCVVDICDRILKKGGKMVMKAFMGDMFNSLKKKVEGRFQNVKVYSPDASRSTSSEVYIISKGFFDNKMVEVKPIIPSFEKRNEFAKKGDLV
ncbi:MAG: RlmE family RNA methyltransferase [archaeon]|nr:RlmE family RNA methyltransferase [archaeon]